MTTGQAGARIGATSNYVRELIRAGRIEAIDISTGTRPSYRVSEESLAKFLRERIVVREVA
ncbi:hypothetical protein [Streptomyces sp. NPDC126503]|uniref:hypothetical protein n=1 Tax=Streptomyces sp. NPDC126503 TaxID=3155315 RepID=UPI00331DE8D2